MCQAAVLGSQQDSSKKKSEQQGQGFHIIHTRWCPLKGLTINPCVLVKAQ